MITSEQMKIYELLERNKVLSSSNIANLMDYKDPVRVRQHIADLRQAFLDGKIDKLVCYKKDKGYFLSTNLKDAEFLIARNEKQAKTMLYNNSILKKRMQVEDNLQLEV